MPNCSRELANFGIGLKAIRITRNYHRVILSSRCRKTNATTSCYVTIIFFLRKHRHAVASTRRDANWLDEAFDPRAADLMRL